jgi:2-polyprenyl-6-methoxyphenol hydroxylase-like FAD-dependent oxidoreductase
VEAIQPTPDERKALPCAVIATNGNASAEGDGQSNGAGYREYLESPREEWAERHNTITHTKPTRKSGSIHKVREVISCGSGPNGLIGASMLQQRGYSVTVLERSSRDQLGTSTPVEPSFNVTLVTRSMSLLKEIGASADDLAIEIYGRQFWHDDGHVTVHPYGCQDTDRLYSIQRSHLVRRLVERAESLGVKIRDSTSVVRLDAKRGELVTESTNGEISHITADHILVADGANSRLREDIARQADTSYVRQPDGFCYATARITQSAVASAGLNLNRIHFVPGPRGIDIGLPNQDGSLSVLLERRDPGNRLLNSDVTDHLDLFTGGCPPLLRRHVTDLTDQLISSPIRRFKYVSCGVWSFGRAVLVGDAARCCPPYTGQGLNAGVHDIASFAAALDATDGDWNCAATLFELERREHSRRVKELTERHGRTLHSGQFGDFQWRVADRVQRLAERVFGFRSAYQRVVFDAVFPDETDMRTVLRVGAHP